MNKKIKYLLILFLLLEIYIWNDSDYIFLSANKYQAKSTITDTSMTGLKINIQNNSGNPITGVIVSIFQDDNLIDQFTTTESEYVNTNISSGNYTVKIESVPSGYDLSKEANNQFEIKEESTTSILIVLDDIIEEKRNHKLLISDIDNNTGEELTGCNVFIYDESGNEYLHFATNGNIKAVEVPNGIYRIVQEDDCSDFYTKIDSDITIKVDDEKDNYPIQLTNKLTIGVSTVKSGMNSTIIAITLGIVIIASGIGLIIITNKNNKK